MRKVLALLLLICMLLGTGTGFAMQEPIEPLELDQRLTKLGESLDMEIFPVDVKYLSDGNLGVQFYLDSETLVIAKATTDGEPVEDNYLMFEDEHGYHEFGWASNFLVEDNEGKLYFGASDGVVQIEADFSETEEFEFDEFWRYQMWCDVESQDNVMINTLMPIAVDKPIASGGAIMVLTYEEGESPAELNQVDGISGATIHEMTDLGEDGIIMSADFGDTAEEIFVLYGSSTGAAAEWSIVELSMVWEEEGPGRGERQVEWTLQDVIALDDTFDGMIATGLEYDGNGFQIAAINEGRQERYPWSTIYQVNRSGKVTDSIELPGWSFYFDTKGNETIVSVMPFLFEGPEFFEFMGFYKIDWGTQSTGSPNRLIRERTMGGKTTATFRDGGYGLLRSEDPGTGMIDYLAPLRTEEKEVRLRMPLCDVMAKVGGAAQNLEILYGEDRIQIPMTALAVQDLLAQMPCETDATIEIQLVRGQDGTVTVTAELLVVEQVDSMTKVVHRMPIPLP